MAYKIIVKLKLYVYETKNIFWNIFFFNFDDNNSKLGASMEVDSLVDVSRTVVHWFPTILLLGGKQHEMSSRVGVLRTRYGVR